MGDMEFENFHCKLIEINNTIESAKDNFNITDEDEEDIKGYEDTDDLLRYISLLNYDKTELIKHECKKEYLPQLKLGEEDTRIINKIFSLKEAMPEEYHKCIRCPCLENDYPNCENCIFQVSCLSGVHPYPEECDESDCYRTFDWIKNKIKTLENII